MPFIGVARDIGFGHRESQHLADRAQILADADGGRIDDAAGAVGRVDRGGARGLAEDVDLVGRADLDVGDLVVGDEQIGHRPVEPDHAAGADRQGDVVGRRHGAGGLGQGRGRRGGGEARRQRGGERGAERGPLDLACS